MANLKELSALATAAHEPSTVKGTELAAHPVDKSRAGYAKRRRVQQFRTPCADSLESLHLTWEVSCAPCYATMLLKSVKCVVVLRVRQRVCT